MNNSSSQVPEIDGLQYIENFISEQEEQSIIDCLDNQSNDWSNDISRRTIQYGFRYDYTRQKIAAKVTAIPEALDFLVERLTPYYDGTNINQMIINEYCGDYQGIKKHIDFLDFGPIISSVSLLDPCVMVFYEQDIVNDNEYVPTGKKFSMVLNPRSVLILKDIARYRWKHEVPPLRSYKKSGVECIPDVDASTYRRVSLTFRTLDQNKFDVLESE
jgi:alkylated DNA repair dioxygenase AlkB